jgi:hypothetical protein
MPAFVSPGVRLRRSSPASFAFGWVNWSDEQKVVVLGVGAAAFVVISPVAAALVSRRSRRWPRQERPTEQCSYRSRDDRVSRVDPDKVPSGSAQSRPGVVTRERFLDRSTQRRRAATNLLVEAPIVTDSRVGVPGQRRGWPPGSCESHRCGRVRSRPPSRHVQSPPVNPPHIRRSRAIPMLGITVPGPAR